MNHKRINKLLKKIANLNDSISEDDDFSKIERDHMLSYIKELYDEAKDQDNEIEELEMPSPEPEEEVIIIEEDEEEEVEEIGEEEEEEEVESVEEVVKIDPALEELFSMSESVELSDKLASLPIKDLTKAMGINERIFTADELFGGDKNELKNMMSALNGLSSFEEAKRVLMHSVAQKYEWTEGSKIKKAEHFIRLVQRRYK